MASASLCEHLQQLESLVAARAYQCDECVKTGATWVHLRTCQTCGGTHCCDSSPNRHASRHAQITGHPVIASAEPGERWLYCYPDDETAQY
jgi:Zn-finger in ubiquitin-hydrolases and other protein